jgi:methionine synthase I (cobalamin-dependent)
VFRADRPGRADGACGTELLARGGALPVDRPDLVLALHRDYLAAGANYLRTNTFAAKPGMSEWRRVIREGARLAREAGAGRPLASIGPGEGVRAVAAAAVEEGCAAIVLETFTDPGLLADAVREARLGGTFVVIALLTVLDPGLDVERAVRLLEGAGAEALGVNCMPPKEAEPVLERMRAATSLPLWAFPSAGKPGELLAPGCWAGAAKRLPGVSVLGGCCGAGPEHLRALD